MKQVKEITPYRMTDICSGVKKNKKVIEYFLTMCVAAVEAKKPWHVIQKIKNRMNRMESCNKFWTMERYEASRVKLLVRTYLCRDKFCQNCRNMKQYVLKQQYLPYLEKYKHSLYHVVLTVPDCTGDKLKETIRRMTDCFKTLVRYLTGNITVKGIDFKQYGFKGCIRSLEIKVNKDKYQPHYHLAAVFDNPDIIANKHINNMFSSFNDRLFSDFESMIQRIWWLLINKQRLTYDSIFSDTAKYHRYDCIIDKCEADGYDNLFGYMIKNFSTDIQYMEYDNFTTLYHALDRVKQIQGSGVFYNNKAKADDSDYTEQEYNDIADYIVADEQPVTASEPLSRLVKDTEYRYIKTKR